MPKKDEYMLDADEHTKLKEEARGTSKGIVCPKMNRQIGGTCAVCDRVAQLWTLYNDTAEEKYKKLAGSLGAKGTFFLNAVFPEAPDKVILMEIGKKAGNQILKGISNSGWTDIGHPKAGVGREMICAKSLDDGFNAYQMTPNLQNADWDVPKSALDNRYNLDNIIDIVNSDVEIFKVSSLKMDQSLSFRILPPWDNGNGNKRVLATLWRHWRSSQAEIDGTVEINLAGTEEEGQLAPWEGDNQTEGTAEPDAVAIDTNQDSSPAKEDDGQGPEPCFGMESAYAAEDDECTGCKDFKACSRVILKKG